MLERTIEDSWINNDYFWVLNEVKNGIEAYNFKDSSKCVESKILRILEIEESLISIFYMMGFNDQFCFNKMEPTFSQSHFLSMQDTTAISTYFLAYDSTQCTELVYSIVTPEFSIEDSTKCNWFYLPDGTGEAKIKGKWTYQLYGKKRESSFNQDIYIK